MNLPTTIGLLAGMLSIILAIFSLYAQYTITKDQKRDSDNSIQKMNDLSSQVSQTIAELRVMQSGLDRTYNSTLTQLVKLIDKLTSQPASQANNASQQADAATMEIVKSAGDLAEIIGEAQTGSATMPGVFLVAREKAKQASCSSNLKQIALATMMFIQDHDEKFPDSDKWCDDIALYLRGDTRVFKCPTADTEFSYAMNKNLSGVNQDRIKDISQTVLFFDSDLAVKNANDDGDSLPKPGRHLERNAIAFADGHVEIVDAERLKTLKWEP